MSAAVSAVWFTTVYYSGRAKHPGCGRRINIKEAVKVEGRGQVSVWCKHCKKPVFFSIQKLQAEGGEKEGGEAVK